MKLLTENIGEYDRSHLRLRPAYATLLLTLLRCSASLIPLDPGQIEDYGVIRTSYAYDMPSPLLTRTIFHHREHIYGIFLPELGLNPPACRGK